MKGDKDEKKERLLSGMHLCVTRLEVGTFAAVCICLHLTTVTPV